MKEIDDDDEPHFQQYEDKDHLLVKTDRAAKTSGYQQPVAGAFTDHDPYPSLLCQEYENGNKIMKNVSKEYALDDC